MPRHFTWETLSCALHGHATFAPDEPTLADRLCVETPWGQAWRCLRCGAYVPGAPRARGAASQAPILRRGAALRDAVIMRVLAIDKGVRGLVLMLVGLGIWRFNGHQDAVARTLDAYLPAARPLATQLGVDLNDLPALHLIERALALPSSTIVAVAAGVAAYGLLNALEGLGLWLMQRWGEYVAVIATSAFLPLEIHELIVKVTPLRVGALLVNLFLVAYLVISKRLFGVRGGAAAHHAALEGQSVWEIEEAAAGDAAHRSRATTPRPRTASSQLDGGV